MPKVSNLWDIMPPRGQGERSDEVMKLVVSKHIDKPPEHVYRIICDFGRWVSKADADVVSMNTTTDVALGIGTKWLDVPKVPGSTVDVEFKSNTMKAPPRSRSIQAMRAQTWPYRRSTRRMRRRRGSRIVYSQRHLL